jgi:hypothetical protein
MTSTRTGRLAPALLAAALVALVLPAGAAAQTAIRAGQTLRGSITSSDPRLDDDSHYDLYTFRSAAGERFRVTLRSEDFDAYLAVGRIEGDECTEYCESDDDGAGGTDAQVTLRFPEAGTYTIRANTLSGDQTGDYTVQLESLGVGPLADEEEDDGVEAPITPTGSITLGQTVRGSLSTGDPTAGDGSHFDTYTFRGRPGQRIAITLRSEDFDAYLGWGRLVSGEWESLASDDDSGGDTDARLVVQLGDDGSYAVRANSLEGGETGDYTLEVRAARQDEALSEEAVDEDGGSDDAAGTAIRGAVRVGQTVRGSLGDDDPRAGDDTFFEEWTIDARAGQTVTVTLRSDEFDAYLAVGSLDGGVWNSLETDDDGAGGTDAQITITFRSAGRYLIRANSLGEGETGAYTLEVRSGS